MDMFDTRTMLRMVQEADKKPTTFLRDRYFGNVITYNTTRVDVDIIGDKGRRVAPFVNPKVGGIVIEDQGYRTESYEAPEVSPMKVTTSEDLLKRSPGETVYSQKSPNERAAEKLGRDLSDLDDIISRREEVMCAEALFTGQVTVKGNGYDEVIKYWPAVSAKQPKETLSTKWDNQNAEPLADLRAIRRKVIQKSGLSPAEIICGTSVLEALLGKLVNGKDLDTRRVDMGMINPSHLPDGVTYWGYLKDSGLDLYSYDSWYLDDNGTEQPFVPADKFLMACRGVATTMAYSCVEVVNENKQEQMMVEGSRVPISWVQRKNPSGRIVQIKSRPLPIIHQVNGFYVVTAI